MEEIRKREADERSKQQEMYEQVSGCKTHTGPS